MREDYPSMPKGPLVPDEESISYAEQIASEIIGRFPEQIQNKVISHIKSVVLNVRMTLVEETQVRLKRLIESKEELERS